MTRTPEEAERNILAMALSIYREPNERAAMRGALGDAAALLDAIALDIRKQHRKRLTGGKLGIVTKEGRMLGSAVTRAANAIAAMRDKIPISDAEILSMHGKPS